jgi:hypothetical protein
LDAQNTAARHLAYEDVLHVVKAHRADKILAVGSCQFDAVFHHQVFSNTGVKNNEHSVFATNEQFLRLLVENHSKGPHVNCINVLAQARRRFGQVNH